MTRSLVTLALIVPTMWASACEQVVDPKTKQPTPIDPIDPVEPVDLEPIEGPCEAHAATLEDIAARFEAERATLEIPGLGFAVVIGDCLFARGLGVVEAGGAAVDGHTRFQLASLTKTLTAMTALSLEEDGIIDRQQPIATHVATASTATLEQLLAHRAGYPIELPNGTTYELADFFAANATSPMWAPPNEVWQYSNAGFAMAGLVLQNASGTDFTQLVRERVLIPAGMQDAAMAVELANTVDPNANVAKGHSGTPGSFTVVDATDEYISSTLYGPMGGAFASAADLGRLMYALMHDNVLSSASLDDMTTSRGPAYGNTSGYGQGMFTYYDGTIFHAGSVAGWLCEIDLDREAGIGIAVLSSADWAMPYDTMYGAFYELVPEPGAAPAGDAPSVVEMVGTYRDDVVLGDVVVASTDGDLTITIGGDAQPLTSYSPGYYYFMYTPWGMEIEASFQRGTSGALYVVTTAGIARQL